MRSGGYPYTRATTTRATTAMLRPTGVTVSRYGRDATESTCENLLRTDRHDGAGALAGAGLRAFCTHL
ncbi:hypothetical protein GCM10010339_61880 [Streptomyces alanosinicus]|uniref:Uncharacterized protein n=1 Tax=Streptomyces alanosinicus TaxID=68171 RepID=A0A918YNT9_9ACTN|nr:hypothetical protein GCM10010339_61880 [Streptomyces alanosinicus]